MIISNNQKNRDDIATALHVRWPEDEVIQVSKFQSGLRKLDKNDTDLIILDEELIDIDIPKAISIIRKHHNIPLIVIGFRTQDGKSLLKALESGADEYIKPPFEPMELLARINAIMRYKKSFSKTKAN